MGLEKLHKTPRKHFRTVSQNVRQVERFVRAKTETQHTKSVTGRAARVWHLKK